jgi:hypothetical protein
MGDATGLSAVNIHIKIGKKSVGPGIRGAKGLHVERGWGERLLVHEYFNDSSFPKKLISEPPSSDFKGPSLFEKDCRHSKVCRPNVFLSK